MLNDVIKVFIPAVFTFFVGIGVTAFLTPYMYKYRLWNRTDRGNPELNPGITENFQGIHNKEDLKTPRVGGVIIWSSILITVGVIWIFSKIFPVPVLEKLDFLSRSQTFLPIFALVSASLIGLGDDLLNVYNSAKQHINGVAKWQRITIVVLIGIVGGLWFFNKLGISGVHIPFAGTLEMGILFIPFFAAVVLATFSGGVIDGIDGLAGGVLATNFAAFGFIAFFQNQIDIAVFCMVVASAIMAFLWFNVPPARFYMGETGMLGLSVTLPIVAFLTDAVLVLPITGIMLVLTSMTVIIQRLSKKFRKGKLVFRVAPLHHHFQSLGWSNEKVVMRYWIISVIAAIIGITVAVIG